MKRFVLLAVTAALAGCALQTTTTTHDPLADFGIAGPYRDLTLAVVYSQNTKEGLAYRQEGLAAQPGFQPAIWFDRMIQGLGRGFKRTIKVENFDDAAASNVDLVAVVDDRATFARAGAKLDVRLSVIFTTLDRQPVETVVGESDKDRVMWTHGAMGAAAQTAQDRFDAALLHSSKLAEFARNKGGRPAAPAATVVSAAKPGLSDIDQLPAAAAVHPKSHAVVIGIENYREGLPAAEFAAADAKLFAEYAKRVLGVPEKNVAVLTNERATKSDFEKYFERWLPNRVEADDEVFVYFSGHGAPNAKTGEAYLVPYDADPTYIEQTGYPIKKLYAELAKLPAKRIVLAMDSCFSGAGGRSVIAKDARPLVNVQTAAVPRQITVISASAGNQISNSYRDQGHGLFTYYFLKGLKAKGDDLRAVYDYLAPEVARQARRDLNADQEPQWRQGQ